MVSLVNSYYRPVSLSPVPLTKWASNVTMISRRKSLALLDSNKLPRRRCEKEFQCACSRLPPFKIVE